jgi:hypothetical protein
LSDLRRATERIEREEFARGHIAPGDPPALPRPAATIVAAWQPPTDDPFQVLLLQRPDTTRFAAGAYVFAGGVIDESDGTDEALELLPRSLREPEGAAAVAALREMLEETCIVPGAPRVPVERAERVRAELLAGEIGLAEAAARLDVDFRGVRAVYLSRWVTPARFARRYDTRFFLTVVRGEEPPTPRLTEELAGHVWITPADAVRRFAAGLLPMLFPTRRTLQELAARPDLEDWFEICRGRVPEPIEPRLLVRGESVRPVLPGDPDYESAV